MNGKRTSLTTASFLVASVVILVAPWLFGAWEMWWFWLFTGLLFLALLLFSVDLTINTIRNTEALPEPVRHRDGSYNKVLLLGLCYIPFLLYALVRSLQAEVYLDADRSFLLRLTPFLLCAVLVFGSSVRQRRILFNLILLDLLLLGIYGLVNHAVTGSSLVLWAPGEQCYIVQDRATGSYFCPDHFAGIMELGLCLALAILLDREQRLVWKSVAMTVVATAVVGVILSKSRGGGLTIVVILAGAVAWGFLQWRRRTRHRTQLVACITILVAITTFCIFPTAYKTRFLQYFGLEGGLRDRSFSQIQDVAKQRVVRSSRGRMISSALRAWRTVPLWGIGPGMHQNLWPHFAASPDGNRTQGIWPSRLNISSYSYEVHSDWVQLLEEYGTVGFLLFLPSIGSVFLMLMLGLRRNSVRFKRSDKDEAAGINGTGFSHCLAGQLACLGMAFHSLGDFNLQMPATLWLLAAITAIPLADLAAETNRDHLSDVSV